MKRLTRLIVLVALVAVAVMQLDTVVAVPFSAQTGAPGASGPYVAGEVLVKFRSVLSPQEYAPSIGARGHTIVAPLNQSGWLQIKLGSGQTMPEGLASYQNDPNVEYAQPNYVYRAVAAPNDPQYGQLWAFKNNGQTITTGTYVPTTGTSGNDLNIEKAWDQITDCSSVVVAVVDTGVNYNQEDLASNMWNGGIAYPNHGYDFVSGDNNPMDLDGHGTHLAGIIGARGNNAAGTAGVCWRASIMAVRVLDATGVGTTATVIQGITFATDNGAKVINMSLGGSGGFDPAFSNAITYAQTNGVVVVVAAGNDNLNNDASGNSFYPCNFTQPNLICVAALDQNYALATFSNFGPTSVDVGAPGTNIRSTYAGTRGVITDARTSGWTFASTTGAGWAYGTLVVNGIPTAALVDPANYPNGQYNNTTNDRTYKAFNLTGVSAAVLQASAAVNVINGDHFRVGYSRLGGDPFAGLGTIVSDDTGVATFPSIFPADFDISGCNAATCTVGFQLQSDGAQTTIGAAITRFNINTLTLNTTSYTTINGTSMATPQAAGLATMLRAYNPQYTSADTVNAITKSGRTTASLVGKTTTSKAIDAISALAYINPPTGLSAAVQ